MNEARIALLPGDGIGPEVVAAARSVLDRVAESTGHQFLFREAAVGGQAIDESGEPLPPATVELCERSDAILLGAVGGPKWARIEASRSPEQGLLQLRRRLGLFANLRPVRLIPAVIAASPLKAELLEDVDLLVVRELTGGIYFGPRTEADEAGAATDTMVYSAAEVERIAQVAFRAARRRRNRLTSVDKANVLATSRLWRRTVESVALQYPGVVVDHQYVDACAMQIVRAPADFDVILTGNLFGDILSDEASVLVGSLGVLPSASLSETGPGLYEPVHGSAPDLVGKGVANPVGAILSAAMLLRYSLGLDEAARAIEAAVAEVLGAGVATVDLSVPDRRVVTTSEFAASVVRHLD